jgi:hypothetical protein
MRPGRPIGTLVIPPTTPERNTFMTEPRNTRRALPRIPKKVFVALVALLVLGAIAASPYLFDGDEVFEYVAGGNALDRAAKQSALVKAESVMRNASAIAASDEVTTTAGLVNALVIAAGDVDLDPDWTISDEDAIRADSCVALTLRYGSSVADVTEVTYHVRLAQPTDNVLFEFVVGEGPCPA